MRKWLNSKTTHTSCPTPLWRLDPLPTDESRPSRDLELLDDDLLLPDPRRFCSRPVCNNLLSTTSKKASDSVSNSSCVSRSCNIHAIIFPLCMLGNISCFCCHLLTFYFFYFKQFFLELNESVKRVESISPIS